MYLERYETHANDDLLEFSFISVGPKGQIKKLIRFTHVVGNLYNLAFGDMDETTGNIDDSITTNNGDGSKVLNTVAAGIRDFINTYPNALIHIRGSTHSRTRLYRRAINFYWDAIADRFAVYGQKENGWEEFIFGEDYSAFLIHLINS
jgi:hypothetical protein